MLRSLLRRVRCRFLPSREEKILHRVPELGLLDSYTMAGMRTLMKHYVLARDVIARRIAGDFVECGVCNGGSAAALACALRGTGRRIWLYDSFEGLPKPAAVDGALARQYTGACRGTEEKLLEAMRLARFPVSQCVVKKGWFQETMRQPLPPSVALLHIDADWYESVTISLETFYDLVPEGGVIVLDDFAHWEGCRHAFYDFIARRQIKPVLERFGYSQAFWVKGREHNREFAGHWDVPPEEWIQ
jgi:O-methyltransferase